MKIGQFAEKNNVTKDGLRHYMELGLLFPQKKGSHYDFDEVCQSSFDNIMELKGLGFSLKSVKEILVHRQLAKLTAYEQDHRFLSTFMNKRDELNDKIKILSTQKAKLDKMVESFIKEESHKPISLGVGMNEITLLGCSVCKGGLMIEGGCIKENQIISGSLVCKCGKKYLIEDGIIVDKIIDDKMKDVYKKDYIEEYISTTSTNYLIHFMNAASWVKKQWNLSKKEENVILDLGSGVGFALRSIYEELDEKSIYIAVDHDISRHRVLKGLLEKAGVKKRILFICSDFLHIPLQDEVVNTIFDFSGSSHYGFSHPKPLLPQIKSLFAKEVDLLGLYILFEKFGLHNRIQEESRKNFKFTQIQKVINELGFITQGEYVTYQLEEGGPKEDYFHKDECVKFLLYHGDRRQ